MAEADATPLDPEVLVRYARFTLETRENLFRSSKAHPELFPLDRSLLNRYIDQIADDRLEFGTRHLQVAIDLVLLANQASFFASPEFIFRAALGRAYYAVHHMMRALHMAIEGWDTDDHVSTVNKIQGLLDKHDEIRDIVDPGRNLIARFKRLLNQRHVADYHPYDRERPSEAAVDFAAEAPQAVLFAQDLRPLVALAIHNNRKKEG